MQQNKIITCEEKLVYTINHQPELIEEFNVDYEFGILGECPSIPINDLISIIENLRFLGATRVYITPDVKQQSYTFEGVKFMQNEDI